MHKEYILLNGFRKAKRGFTAGFHVPLTETIWMRNTSETDYDVIKYNHMSAQTGILNSLVTRVFCPVQTTPT